VGPELTIAAFIAIIALGAGVRVAKRGTAEDAPSALRQMLSETLEYRTSLSPQAALQAVEVRFSATPGPGLTKRDIRLTERTPTCLRYAVNNRAATFLETVVATSPWGAGSAVTVDVVRWLDHNDIPAAGANLKWMRDDIEEVLRSADPRVQVLVRSND
jgi:hypothetical protein